MREDQVQTGVQFLKHPKVQAAPLSQRITFLERKGLTQEEIAEALERVKRGDTAPESSSQLDQLYEGDAGAASLQYRRLAPPVDYLPPQPMIPPPPSLWHNPMVTVPSALAAGLALGAGATHAFRMFRGEADQTIQTSMLEEVGPSQPGIGGNGGAMPPLSDQQQLQLESVVTVGDQQQQVDIVTESPQLQAPDPMLELAKAIETQAQALSALAQASERSRLDLHAVLNTQVATQTSEIRSELSTIKQMLLMSGAGGAMYSSIGGQGSNSNSPQLALPPAITPRLVESSDVNGTPERGSPQRTEVEKAETSGNAVVGGASSNDVKTTSTSTNDRGATTERSLENRLQEMRQALANMIDQNEGAILTDAADMMLIYLNNLIKYPLVPRFRKVALINQGYKERVAKAKGHQAFLRSVGYHEAPTYFEWGWHSAEGQQSKDNAAVLQSAMALLTAVKNGQTPPDLPPPQQESAQPQQHQQTDDAVLSPANAIISVGSVVKESISFEATSTVAAGMSPARASPPAPTGAMSAPSPPSTTTGPGTPKPAVPNPRVHPQHPAPSPSRATSQQREVAQPQQASEDAADGGPQYPKSFIEIMQMTERGETPGGIQEVENRLSKDASQLVNGESRHSTAPPPPKPWEVKSNGAAGAAAVGEEGQLLGQYGSEAQEHVLQVPG